MPANCGSWERFQSATENEAHVVGHEEEEEKGPLKAAALHKLWVFSTSALKLWEFVHVNSKNVNRNPGGVLKHTASLKVSNST